MEGLGALPGHPSPPDGCGDLLTAPLQAPASSHARAAQLHPKPQGFWASWGWAGPGAQPAVVVQQLLQD